MEDKILDTTFVRDIYLDLAQYDEGVDYDEIVRNALAQGGDPTPGETAKRIREMILECMKETRKVMSEPSAALQRQLNKLYRKVGTCKLKDQISIYDQLLFSLRVMTNEEVGGVLNEEGCVQKVVDAYNKQRVELPLREETVKNLQEKIACTLDGAALSPRYVARFLKELNVKNRNHEDANYSRVQADDLMFTSGVLEFSKKSFTLRYLYATQRYLANRETTTPEEAAVFTCFQADLQGISDACDDAGILSEVTKALIASFLVFIGAFTVSCALDALAAGGVGLIACIFGILYGACFFYLGGVVELDEDHTYLHMFGSVFVEISCYVRKGWQYLKEIARELLLSTAIRLYNATGSVKDTETEFVINPELEKDPAYLADPLF